MKCDSHPAGASPSGTGATGGATWAYGSALGGGSAGGLALGAVGVGVGSGVLGGEPGAPGFVGADPPHAAASHAVSANDASVYLPMRLRTCPLDD